MLLNNIYILSFKNTLNESTKRDMGHISHLYFPHILKQIPIMDSNGSFEIR